MTRFYDLETDKELFFTFDTADNILKTNKIKQKVLKP